MLNNIVYQNANSHNRKESLWLCYFIYINGNGRLPMVVEKRPTNQPTNVLWFFINGQGGMGSWTPNLWSILSCVILLSCCYLIIGGGGNHIFVYPLSEKANVYIYINLHKILTSWFFHSTLIWEQKSLAWASRNMVAMRTTNFWSYKDQK